MDLTSYSLLFAVVIVLSVFWFYWLQSFQKSESKQKVGTKPSELALKINPEEYTQNVIELFGKQDLLIPDTQLHLFHVSKIQTTTPPKPKDIERELKVQYKRSIYVEKSFPLEITIAAKGDSITVTDAEKKVSKIEIEKLNFQAFEKEPKISVELKFAEGDFKVNKTKKTQKLSEKKPTVFRFVVTPLKAEDCILTIVFSFTDKIPLFKTSQRVTSHTNSKENGKTTTEDSEETTMVPVSDDEKEIEIKSIDLLIEVKQIFGLNAKQLGLIKKAVPIVAAFILFAYQLVTSKFVLTDDVVAAIPPILVAFGFEGADKLLGDKTKKEDAKTELV